ncbi:hypothetical protein D9M68_894670 [compost metagenome]
MLNMHLSSWPSSVTCLLKTAKCLSAKPGLPLRLNCLPGRKVTDYKKTLVLTCATGFSPAGYVSMMTD